MNSSAVSWGGVVDSPWGHGRPGMNNSILSTGTERLDPAGERYASLENVHKLVEDELTRDEQDRLEIENVGQGAGYEKVSCAVCPYDRCALTAADVLSHYTGRLGD